jgi:hypothetical protein
MNYQNRMYRAVTASRNADKPPDTGSPRPPEGG